MRLWTQAAYTDKNLTIIRFVIFLYSDVILSRQRQLFAYDLFHEKVLVKDYLCIIKTPNSSHLFQVESYSGFLTKRKFITFANDKLFSNMNRFVILIKNHRFH